MAKKFKWKHNEEGDEWYAYYGDEELGYIEFYDNWKKYVWNQGEDIIMSHSCIMEVAKKLKELEDGTQED
ncbi:MAG: hypothetical protein GY861_17120 [bacterium]|nr:hypothetical protein [bacterium]